MFFTATGLTTQIYNNHIKSALLLAGFPVLLLLMTAAFFAGLDAMTQGAATQGNGGSIDWRHVYNAGVRGVLQDGQWALMFAGTWFLIAYFFNGSMMRMATGSRPVTREQMPRLYNLLENLCISRGIAMPEFEIIDSPAMNAFATGINQKNFRIVLTQGLVDALKDDELEAVIAHELTHIMNRDVRLLIIAVVFVGMISFFAQLLFRLLIHGARIDHYEPRGERKGGGMIILLLALAILLIGYVFAIAVRFALSRQREYLADEGAVVLTKNPDALMRALLRISGHDAVRGMPNQVQQMCIENSENFLGIFTTHPPVADRIRTISELTKTPVPQIAAPVQAAGPWG